MKTTCGSCRFWSDLLAEVKDNHVVAMCLCPTQQQRYRGEREKCPAWAVATFGAVDDPAHDGTDPYSDKAA